MLLVGSSRMSGMNDSVLQSVEDNGNPVPADVVNHNSSENGGSIENVSVNGLLALPDDGHEEGIGSPKQSINVDSFIRVESPGGSVHSTRKGFGLKKWRRIKRDGPIKDEFTPIDDGSKLLKRGLTGSVNPPFKHVDLSSAEAMQSSEGSVGSVNMVHHDHHHHHHHPGVANRFSPDLGFMFTVGQAFEKSEEHSGNSIGAKNIGGKSFSGSQGKDTIKTASEEGVKTRKEKPCSSMDSDLRSSDFVFSSDAGYVSNRGEKDERLMLNHIGEFSKGGRVREEVQTHSRRENGDKEEDRDESKKNSHCWAEKDPLADSIRSFTALQEALWKEVKSFQELGKESIPLHSNIDELSSPDQSRNEIYKENNSTSSGSQVLILKQKVKHLEHKLEEARAVLETKDTRIQELKNSMIESELEDIFQRKVEIEIEHLVVTRSLNSSLQVLKQPNELHSLTEDPEGNRGNMLGKTCKFGFYFLTQLILLVSILGFLVLRFSPASRFVIPT